MGWEKFREGLFDGIYHELGHIIADSVYFPNNSTIQGMLFGRQPNGAYMFNTVCSDVNWKQSKHILACAVVCISGGVFQQIKTLDMSPNNYNHWEKLISYVSPKRALIAYLQRVIQSQIKGMERDFDICNEGLIQLGGKISLEKAKKKAILLLLPYANKNSIDEISNIIADRIVEQKSEVFVSVEEIKPYLIEKAT